ncbi:hypothetical protein MRX96_017226 [Rhipicephalus microplus]
MPKLKRQWWSTNRFISGVFTGPRPPQSMRASSSSSSRRLKEFGSVFSQPHTPREIRRQRVPPTASYADAQRREWAAKPCSPLPSAGRERRCVTACNGPGTASHHLPIRTTELILSRIGSNEESAQNRQGVHLRLPDGDLHLSPLVYLSYLSSFEVSFRTRRI